MKMKQQNALVMFIGVAVYHAGGHGSPYERVVVETRSSDSPEDCASFEFRSSEDTADYIRDVMRATRA